jgi:hypothetical protein
MSNKKNNIIYGNCQVLDPNGELLFLCLPKKIKWYLSRNLAVLISENPTTIKLKFKPKGKTNKNDLYSLSEKKNICVVCGTDLDLTKHHIIPYCYRKHFPDKYKNHNSHDIVPICWTHHIEYEKKYARIIKTIFAKEYNAPFDNRLGNDYDLILMIKFSKLLIDKTKKLPYKKVKELIRFIRNYHGPYGKLYHIILLYSSVTLKKSKIESHGEIVVNKIIKENKLQGFIEMWRRNFVESMKPRYMPKYWKIKRK